MCPTHTTTASGWSRSPTSSDRARRRSCALGLIALVSVLVGCPDNCPEGSICLLAGEGTPGFNGDGLAARKSWMYLPSDVWEGRNGLVRFVDFNNMRLREIDGDGKLRTFVGSGEHGFSTPGVMPLESPFENPVDAIEYEGGLLLANLHEGRVVRIPDGGPIESFAGSGELGNAGDFGPAVDAQFEAPLGIALAADGTAYIADNAHHCVRVVGPDGIVSPLLGSGVAGDALTPPTGDVLRYPERLLLDEDAGVLYVSDAGNARILAWSLTSRELTVFAGRGERGFGGDFGPAVDALLDRPVGMVLVPGAGFLFADAGNAVLRLVDGDGIIETVAGGGEDTGSRRVPAEPLEWPLRAPSGLALDAEGDLLVADALAHAILRFRGAKAALAR
jgi:hypothetical protein